VGEQAEVEEGMIVAVTEEGAQEAVVVLYGLHLET
jgi:hypothetical protein